MKNTLKTAFISTVPVMTGYLVLGFGFGIVLSSGGFGMALALAMSIFIYAGSMQYVAIGLITAATPLLTVALTTLMVNARHLFYGISMLDKYKNTGKRKPYLIFALTDETYSLVCNDNPAIAPEHKNDYYLLVSLLDQLYWVSGTALGVAIGSLVSFNSEGIDFALTALFVTVFVDQWLSTRKHGPAIIGLAVSVICLVVFGSESFLIPAMLGIGVLLCIGKEGGNDE